MIDINYAAFDQLHIICLDSDLKALDISSGLVDIENIEYIHLPSEDAVQFFLVYAKEMMYMIPGITAPGSYRYNNMLYMWETLDDIMTRARHAFRSVEQAEHAIKTVYELEGWSTSTEED